MRDKILVVSTLLIALMVISMTVAPSLAFVYPDGSQDNLYEIYGPHIDKILVKKYAGLDPELQALQNGEIDFTDWALTKTWVDTLAVDPDVRVLGYGGEVGYYTFNFNHNNNTYLGNPENPAYLNPINPNPTAVVSLRQAFSHLIDRVALSAGPGEGLYDPIFTPIPAYMVYWIHPDIKYGEALEEIAYPPSIQEAADKLTMDCFLLCEKAGSPADTLTTANALKGDESVVVASNAGLGIGEHVMIEWPMPEGKCRRVCRTITGFLGPDIIYFAGQPLTVSFPVGSKVYRCILRGNRYWDHDCDAIYDGASEDFNLLIYARMDKLRKGAADALCAGLDDPAVMVPYDRFDVTGAQAWQKCMVEKDYHMYTAGWIYIGPDPDYLYDLYHWDNYYHPEDPPNWGAISKHDIDMQTYLWNIKTATNVPFALANTLLFQEQFAATASEIPLASTSAPKAYNKWYTGGNNGVPNGDAEDKYRGKMWTHVLNEKGQGEGSWFTTLNAYPVGEDFGDGNMVARWGWKEIDMPQTLNPMYSSWYWESDIYGRIYDGLGGRDPMTKGPVEVPYLGDNWTVSEYVDPDDGLTKAAIEVQVRPDVLWSDGHAFDVDDVIYTFIDMPRELKAKGCPDVWWQPTLDQILTFYKLDKYTVRVLMKVNAVWAVNWVVGNIIVPKHIWQPYIATHTVPEISGDFSDEPAMLVGTGPFKFVENTPNTVTMIRYEDYYQFWDKCINMYDGPMNVHGIQVYPITPTVALSPYKILQSPTATGSVRISVPIKNLDELHWEDFNKTVELIHCSGAVQVLQPEINFLLGPGEYYFEYFDLYNLPKGLYTIKVTLEITSGHNYDYWHDRPDAEHFLGPKSFYKNFAITIPADINGDGKVDIFDIVVIAACFGSEWGDPNFNIAADLVKDGVIDIFDIVVVAGNFGYDCHS